MLKDLEEEKGLLVPHRTKNNKRGIMRCLIGYDTGCTIVIKLIAVARLWQKQNITKLFLKVL